MIINRRHNEPKFWEDILRENKEPIYELLIENYNIIKKELLRLLKFKNFLFLTYPTRKIKNYFAGDCKGWKLSPLTRISREPVAKKRVPKIFLLYPDILSLCVRFICPKTYSLFKGKIEKNLISIITFTELLPNSSIPPHIHPIGLHGSKRMMYHLGIMCDDEAQITVGEKTKSWKEGEVLAFKSTGPYRHSVTHKGEKNRIIFAIEVKEDHFKNNHFDFF